MEEINRRFLDKFSNQWIKVKFYKDKPKLNGVKLVKKMRFCEATKLALIEPVMLNKKSISCVGAKHAFGWGEKSKKEIIQNCNNKLETDNRISVSMLSSVACLKDPIEYIGLNMPGIPDIAISYVMPEEVMNIIKKYHNRTGENLDVSLSPMMSICSGIAVKTYLDNDINISFGCDDSRRYAEIRRNDLAVGIPSKLFKLFID